MSKAVIGIVGAIGSGKSMVAAELVKRGGFLIAADPFGHEALRQPDIIAKVKERWGAGVIKNGGVDRRALGTRVFADGNERGELEKLVFPFIERRIEEERRRAENDAAISFIVFDAAIMLEAGWNRICDWLAFVHCPRPDRLARLASNRGLTAGEVEARENAQWPLLAKMLQCDDIIDNSGTRQQTALRVGKSLDAFRAARFNRARKAGTLETRLTDDLKEGTNL